MEEILPYILLASLATILTRFLPFWIFKKKTLNRSLASLQKNSGLFIMTVLAIYALKTMLPSPADGYLGIKWARAAALLFLSGTIVFLTCKMAQFARYRRTSYDCVYDNIASNFVLINL